MSWFRLGQLQAHDLGHGAADEEEHERRHHVRDADALVIGGRDPAEDPGGAPLRRRLGLGRKVRSILDDRHGLVVPPLANQASNCGPGTACTLKRIVVWSRPQNSEQTPSQ